MQDIKERLTALEQRMCNEWLEGELKVRDLVDLVYFHAVIPKLLQDIEALKQAGNRLENALCICRQEFNVLYNETLNNTITQAIDTWYEVNPV